MVYKVLGVRCGDLSEGLEILFAEFTETGGKWNQETVFSEQNFYTAGWKEKLENAGNDSISEYHRLNNAFGHYIGELLNQFIRQNKLDHKVHLVAVKGYTISHIPVFSAVIELGHGAYIAAETKLPVVSDLFALNTAFGGQRSPEKNIGEKLLPLAEGPSGHSPTLIIAMMGVLRWREEANMLSSSTGARQDSIGGALWLGTS